MELCWLTTEKCNQKCKYCDRFTTAETLSTDDYKTILNKLISYGVNNITFGGGESLLVPCFSDIIVKCKKLGIGTKLVTNGKLISQNIHLLNYLDEITISIDSINLDTNEELGRGYNHFKNVCDAINVIKKNRNDTYLNINSVVTRININDIYDIPNMFDEWNIKLWKIFRFCPLRGSAEKNRDFFTITDAVFSKVKKNILNMSLTCEIQFRDYIDMEKRYLLITPKGELCVSRNLKDVVVGDMRTEELKKWFL